jgi:DNA topoisomerase-1
MGCSNYPECRYTRPIGAESGEGEASENGERNLGTDPVTGQAVWLKSGRFGPYVQLGEGEKPKRASLPKGWTPPTVDLEKALRLLRLPRELGPHPDDAQPILAGIGRYGPYVQHGGTYANLPDPDEVFDIGLNRAVALLAEKRGAGGRGGRGRAAPAALKELGPHPGSGEPVRVLSGRYGPYVACGGVNANVPRGADPQGVTLEQAVALLAERAAKGGGKTKAKRAPKAGGATKAKAATAKRKKAS